MQKVVHARLTDLGPVGLEGKLALAPLFALGMTRDDLHAVVAGSTALRDLVGELTALVTLWKETPDADAGELLFEIDDDNAYTSHLVG